MIFVLLFLVLISHRVHRESCSFDREAVEKKEKRWGSFQKVSQLEVGKGCGCPGLSAGGVGDDSHKLCVSGVALVIYLEDVDGIGMFRKGCQTRCSLRVE